MKVHELKCWPEYFEAIVRGVKTFEIRKDDRDFNVGDFLELEEWDPTAEEYTGRKATAFVTYVMRVAQPLQHGPGVALDKGPYLRTGLEFGYVAMSIELREVRQ